MDKTDFIIIAHRGASSYAPENTFAAYDLALEIKPDECDKSHLGIDVDRRPPQRARDLDAR